MTSLLAVFLVWRVALPGENRADFAEEFRAVRFVAVGTLPRLGPGGSAALQTVRNSVTIPRTWHTRMAA